MASSSILPDLPELPPEVKLNMKLDDIIKYEKLKAGVSHNMQFQKPFRGKSKPKHYQRNNPCSYFYKKFSYRTRRFRSQNWRLRGNGPNTPRYKIRAFLEKKLRTAPLNSVFHRLGWTPLQQAAQNKLFYARNYIRPPRVYFQSKWRNQSGRDPQRLRKLLSSTRYYQNYCNGLPRDIDIQTNQPPLPLSKLNLEKLSNALGGHITSVREEASDAGSTITITRVDDGRVGMSSQGSDYNTCNSISSKTSVRDYIGMQYNRNLAQNMAVINSLNNGMNTSMTVNQNFIPFSRQSNCSDVEMESNAFQNRPLPPLAQPTVSLFNRPSCMTQAEVETLPRPPVLNERVQALNKPILGAQTEAQLVNRSIVNDRLSVHSTPVPLCQRFQSQGSTNGFVPLKPNESMEF